MKQPKTCAQSPLKTTKAINALSPIVRIKPPKLSALADPSVLVVLSVPAVLSVPNVHLALSVPSVLSAPNAPSVLSVHHVPVAVAAFNCLFCGEHI